MRRVLPIRHIFLVCSLNILVERHLPSAGLEKKFSLETS